VTGDVVDALVFEPSLCDVGFVGSSTVLLEDPRLVAHELTDGRYESAEDLVDVTTSGDGTVNEKRPSQSVSRNCHVAVAVVVWTPEAACGRNGVARAEPEAVVVVIVAVVGAEGHAVAEHHLLPLEGGAVLVA